MQIHDVVRSASESSAELMSRCELGVVLVMGNRRHQACIGVSAVGAVFFNDPVPAIVEPGDQTVCHGVIPTRIGSGNDLARSELARHADMTLLDLGIRPWCS